MRMNEELLSLVNRLDSSVCTEASVIKWGSPVPSFGDLSLAKIATIGLNPSNREFVDINGDELVGIDRRFHTLNSLGISKWSEVNKEHLNSILELCTNYFQRNPYDGWFKKLDYLISGTKMSYYFPSAQACHLDLVPYATSCKWTNLSIKQRSLLLNWAGDTLGLLLKDSQIELLILNGKTVIKSLEKISNTKFNRIRMSDWTLPRKSNDGIVGYAYKGVISKVGGIDLGREIVVIGYNHNIQSSFGVTAKVQNSIRSWVSQMADEIFI